MEDILIQRNLFVQFHGDKIYIAQKPRIISKLWDDWVLCFIYLKQKNETKKKLSVVKHEIYRAQHGVSENRRQEQAQDRDSVN
jgi:hypothetical protein